MNSVHLEDMLRHKEQLLSVAENLRKGLEKDLDALTKTVNDQQSQILSYMQLLREKETRVKTLENSEFSLQTELNNTKKRLQEVEMEVSLYRKVREEVGRNKEVIRTVEEKIGRMEEERGRLCEENKAQKMLLDELKRKARTSDLRTYMDHIKSQTEETARALKKTQENQLLADKKLTESERRFSHFKRNINHFLNQFKAWISNFPENTVTPAPSVNFADTEVQNNAISCLEMLETAKEIVMKRIRNVENEKKDLEMKVNFFEKTTMEWKNQIEKLGKQVEKQEMTTKAAVLDRESREKYWQLKQTRLKSKRNQFRDELKSLKQEIEGMESGLKPLLLRVGRLGYSSVPGLSVSTVVDCVYFVVSRLEEREGELGEVKEKWKEACRYREQAEELSLQLKSMGIALGQAEVKGNRSEQVTAQLRALEATHHQLSVQYAKERERRETASSLLDSTLDCIVRLKGDYTRLKSYLLSLHTTLHLCTTSLSSLIPPFSPSIPRFRASVIVILAVNRLKRTLISTKNDYRYFGLKLTVTNTAVDREFIRELLARATGKFMSSLGSLFPKRISRGEAGLRGVVEEVRRKLQGITELSNLKNTEIAIKDDKIRRLEANLAEITQKYREIVENHKKCPSISDYFSLQESKSEFESLLSLHQSRLEEVETQSKEYLSVIDRLREAVYELQEEIRKAGEQLEAVSKENRLKDMHIESLEGIVKRLEG